MIDSQSLWPDDRFAAIVPIIKVSLEGYPSLVGTGFFITAYGHLITARHVIDDNVDERDRDIGGIGALLFTRRDFGEFLPLAKTYRHQVADIAVSETRPRRRRDESLIETPYLALSIKELPIESQITSRFFCHADLEISMKDLVLPAEERSVGTFSLTHGFIPTAPGMPEPSAGVVTSEYGYQDRKGLLRCHWRPIRDTVMLPFPVFESNLAIPASGSGGPVFNTAGLVVGINTTGFPGTDIAYHTYIESALSLGVRVRRSEGEGQLAVVSLHTLAQAGLLDIEGLN